MMLEPTPDQQKQQLRQQAKLARQQLPDRDRRSRRVMQRLANLPAYAAATRVLWYVDTGQEVQTQPMIRQRLALPAASPHDRLVVPYCRGEQLELAWIVAIDELAPGSFGILEPTAAVQQSPQRRVAASDLELVLVPGVAFDRGGGRLGYGRGFYDRLLAQVAANTTLVGLAFDCQLAETVPQEPHDIALDFVVSESAVYDSASCQR